MAAPTFTQGALAGLVSSQSLGASKNLAVVVDGTTKFETQLTPMITTGASVAAGSYTKHEAYQVAGTNTTLSSGPSAGATSLSVASGTGFAKGQKILVVAASTGIGEMRTVSAVSGTTLTVDALINSYATSDKVYVIEQLPTYPGTQALGGAANTSYSRTAYLKTGMWGYVLSNTDASNAVTVYVSKSTIDTIA